MIFKLSVFEGSDIKEVNYKFENESIENPFNNSYIEETTNGAEFFFFHGKQKMMTIFSSHEANLHAVRIH